MGGLSQAVIDLRQTTLDLKEAVQRHNKLLQDLNGILDAHITESEAVARVIERLTNEEEGEAND